MLYGDSGTGKTALAKMLLCENQMTLINFTPQLLHDYGLESLNQTHQLAVKLAPSIIFIDDCDWLLNQRHNRMSSDQSRAIKFFWT